MINRILRADATRRRLWGLLDAGYTVEQIGAVAGRPPGVIEALLRVQLVSSQTMRAVRLAASLLAPTGNAGAVRRATGRDS